MPPLTPTQTTSLRRLDGTPGWLKGSTDGRPEQSIDMGRNPQAGNRMDSPRRVIPVGARMQC